MRKIKRIILCMLMVCSSLVITGCKKSDEVKDELQSAIEKSKSATSYNIKDNEKTITDITYLLEDDSTLGENKDTSTKRQMRYYLENDKVNYYEEDNYSDGGKYYLVVKDNVGQSFHEDEQKKCVSNNDESEDYSNLSPISQNLHETSIQDLGEFATYSRKEDEGEILITVQADDIEGLSKSETDRYYKDFGGEIIYNDFKIVYHINSKGYISSLEIKYDYTLNEKFEQAVDQGYNLLVKEKSTNLKFNSSVQFDDYNKEVDIDFSLLDK